MQYSPHRNFALSVNDAPTGRSRLSEVEDQNTVRVSRLRAAFIDMRKHTGVNNDPTVLRAIPSDLWEWIGAAGEENEAIDWLLQRLKTEVAMCSEEDRQLLTEALNLDGQYERSFSSRLADLQRSFGSLSTTRRKVDAAFDRLAIGMLDRIGTSPKSPQT